MKLYFDNKLAINIAHNPIQYDQTKSTVVGFAHPMFQQKGRLQMC